MSARAAGERFSLMHHNYLPYSIVRAGVEVERFSIHFFGLLLLLLHFFGRSAGS